MRAKNAKLTALFNSWTIATGFDPLDLILQARPPMGLAYWLGHPLVERGRVEQRGNVEHVTLRLRGGDALEAPPLFVPHLGLGQDADLFLTARTKVPAAFVALCPGILSYGEIEDSLGPEDDPGYSWGAGIYLL